MNWHYDNPVENGRYICCVDDRRVPVVLYWNEEKRQWGDWSWDWEWQRLDINTVVCYIGFHEIPMPEGWKN